MVMEGILTIYSISRNVSKGMKSFFKDAQVSIMGEVEMSGKFGTIESAKHWGNQQKKKKERKRHSIPKEMLNEKEVKNRVKHKYLGSLMCMTI